MKRQRLGHTYPAAIAVALLVALQLGIPQKLNALPIWVLPTLEAGLLGLLLLAQPKRDTLENRERRWVVIALLAVINLANISSLGTLVALLVSGGKATGVDLLLDAFGLWLSNIILFALWYFELDGGGPVARHHKHQPRDFLFANMTVPEFAGKQWQPGFVDYVFLSFTNASAFSPTDTLPLTAWAKLLMMLQALISLLTVALVAARAVNILA